MYFVDANQEDNINTDLCCKAHYVDESENGKHNLIMLVRDYKECVTRHHCYPFYSENRDMSDFGDHAEALCGEFSEKEWSYFGYIKLFDKWTAPKKMFYYEDIVSNPAQFIMDLAEFSYVRHDQYGGGWIRKAASIIYRYQKHQQRSLGLYTNGNKSITNGDKDKIGMHKKQLAPLQRIKWDNILRDNDPELFDKYLERYAE